MKTGGYKIIDLEEKNFTNGVKQTVPGIYEALESNNRATMLSGIVYAGDEYDDAFVPFKVSQSKFIGTAYGFTITISSDDGVILANS